MMGESRATRIARPPRSVFLSTGTCKVKEGLATLVGAQAKNLQRKVLYNKDVDDPYQSGEFARTCSNTGPSIGLLKKESSAKIIGGYTHLGWDAAQNGQHEDMEAFLFIFTPELLPGAATKFSARQHRVNQHGHHLGASQHVLWGLEGPNFGADLCVTETGVSCTPGQSSFNTTPGFIEEATAAGPFKLEILAVWHTAWGAPDNINHWHGNWQNTASEVAWLPGVVWDEQECAKLISSLTSFKPPADLPKVNILLTGEVGAGKSSLISSIDSIFKRRISRRAPHGQATSSFTRLLTRYTFRSNAQNWPARGAFPPGTSGLPRELPFAVWDSPGWTTHNYQTGELGYILDGNICSGVDVTQPNLPSGADFKQQPSLANKMHVVFFVVPCEEATNPEFMARLRTLKCFCTDRGIPVLVFLTKIDEYDPENLEADITQVFHSEKIRTVVQDAANLSGVGGTKDVFPLKSFSQEVTPTVPVSILMMRALQQALYAADDYLEGPPWGTRLAPRRSSGGH